MKLLFNMSRTVPEWTERRAAPDSVRPEVGGEDPLHLETDGAAVDRLLRLPRHAVAVLHLAPPHLELPGQCQVLGRDIHHCTLHCNSYIFFCFFVINV